MQNAAAAGKQLAVTETGEGAESLGYELEVAADAGSGSKVLGSREFARYYKQHHKPADTRTSVVINTVVAKYDISSCSCKLPVTDLCADVALSQCTSAPV